MKRRATRISLAFLMVLGACGSESDPFTAGVDGGDGTGDDTTDDPPEADAATASESDAAVHACAPTPMRVIVLGDSITDCSVVGGENGADCVSKQFFDDVKARYAPDAVYENYAVGGAVLNDLKTQLAGVPVKPGHALFMVYMGGNDLAPYIFQSDQQAQAAYTGVKSRLEAAWANFFTVTGDTAKFPDGATVIINNQYNPFDDCTAPPYNLSAVKTDLLHQFNANVALIVGAQPERSILVDQYTDFLGHGHHYSVSACPHYASNAKGFMKDLIHPNAEGNRFLAEHLKTAVNALYASCE